MSVRVPLRDSFVPPANDDALRITHRDESDTIEFAANQLESQFLQLAYDNIVHVLGAVVGKSPTLASLGALVNMQLTCKLLNHLSKRVTTILDSNTVVREDRSQEGDDNWNGQRFILHNLKTATGHPAGKRWLLTVPPPPPPPAQEPPHQPQQPTEPLLLIVYRNTNPIAATSPGLSAVIAKKIEDDSLLCIELSILSLLRILSGHCNTSAFNAEPLSPPGRNTVPKWTINPLMNSYVSPYEGKVIVFGDSEAGAAASNDALNMDSINPVIFEVHKQPVRWSHPDDRRIFEERLTPLGEIKCVSTATFRVLFVTSGCSAFSGYREIANPVALCTFFGMLEPEKVAAIPRKASDDLLPRIERWPRRSSDKSKISEENIVYGRRQAILAADYKVKRVMLHENNARDDGSLCEGHPDFSRVVNELEALNANTSGVVYEDSQLVPEPKRRKSKAKAPKVVVVPRPIFDDSSDSE